MRFVVELVTQTASNKITFSGMDEFVLTHINHVAKELTPMIMKKLDKVSMTVSYNYGEKQKVKHFIVLIELGLKALL